MADPLNGSRAKVQRAKEHFQGLIIAHAQFMNLNPHGFVIDENPETGERIWRARISRETPVEWRVVAGDVVHNLRAALDFLAYQLWVANGKKGTTEDDIMFRVARFREAAKIEAAKSRVKKELGPTAAAIWDRLQPYRAGDGYERHPLYVLHELDIWDKHRLLNVVWYAVQSYEGFIGGPGENVHIEHFAGLTTAAVHGPLTDGAELQRLTLGESTPNVQMNFKFTFHVTFEQGGPGKGEPLLKTLDQLVSFVDETITLFAPLLA